MSLRFRLLLAIALALLVACAAAVTLSCVRAAGSIRTELDAAFEVGLQTVRNALADIGPASDETAEAIRVVHTFDGNRHVRSALLGPRGEPLATSQPLRPDAPPPAWFVRLLAPPEGALQARLPLGATGLAIALSGYPLNETSEVWATLEDSAADLLLLCLIATCATLLTVQRGLRPLTQLAAALDRVQPGHHGERLHVRGPAEIIRLADGFNRMEERLAAMEAQNQRLNEQIMTLLDEERAELARDLHDEVGPYLFSISVSAATVERLASSAPGGAPESGIDVHTRLIREDVGHVQRHVRGILERLHPPSPVEAGLASAIASLVAFWRARHAEVRFCCEISPDSPDWDETMRDVAYRVVQEAVSNALRHAGASRIDIAIGAIGDAMQVQVRDNGRSGGSGGSGRDGARREGAQPGPPGLGLSSMAARVSGAGGALRAGRRDDGPGWVVAASLPHRARAATERCNHTESG